MGLNVSRRARAGVALALAVTGVLAVLGVASGPAAAGSKSFRLVSLHTAAEVLADGTMEVREEIVYAFDGGPFTIGTRSFAPASRDLVQDFAATEDGRSLTVDPPSETPTGEWEWHFASPATNEQRTFVLTYRVDDALTVGPDVGELYWQFLGDDHPGIDTMTVELAVPGDSPASTPDSPDDDASVLRAWGHGPASGAVTVNPGLVTATVDDVPSRQFVELRVLIPTTELDVEPSTPPRLAQVLEEERSFIENEDAEQTRRRFGGLLGPIAAGLGLVGAGVLWRRFGREPKPDLMIGEYWREPLDDPPAMVIANLQRGSAPIGQAIASTLIDLAQRGYLRITAEVEERWGPDHTVHTIHWQGREFGPEVQTYERSLVAMVLRGRNQMSTDELTEWGQAHRSAAAKELAKVQKEITAEAKLRGFAVSAQPRANALVLALTVAVAGAGLVARWLGSGWGWLAIGVAPLILFGGGWLVRNRSTHAATEAAKAKGLRNFLRDFSQLEDAPVGHLVLWERYLVYAVTLGVSAELLRGLATRLPAVAQDPAFGAWYIGPAGRLDHIDGFNNVGGSISSSFSPPSNSSGSGGGFSGGGGGGGGGGGFGAR